MKSMLCIYIAGSYRSNDAYKVWENINKARELAIKVWQQGAVALCPHMNSMFFEGAATPKQFIDGTLELMRRCDAVLVVPGSEASIGTQGEIKEAKRLRKPVFYAEQYPDIDGNLYDWLKELSHGSTYKHVQVSSVQRSVRTGDTGPVRKVRKRSRARPTHVRYNKRTKQYEASF